MQAKNFAAAWRFGLPRRPIVPGMGDRDFLKQGGCVGRQGRSGARSQARTGFIGTYSDARATDPGRQRDCCCSPLGAGGLFWRSDFRCSAFVRTSCGPIVCAHFAGTSFKAPMMCLRTMVSPRGVLTRVQGRLAKITPKSRLLVMQGDGSEPPLSVFQRNCHTGCRQCAGKLSLRFKQAAYAYPPAHNVLYSAQWQCPTF